jgi:hypothetical protein
MQCPASGTEAGRSTDFNILVHLDRIGDSRLTQGYGRGDKQGSIEGAYVDNGGSRLYQAGNRPHRHHAWVPVQTVPV